MSTQKKQPRAGRSPKGDSAKKIVSLTIDPALISQIDSYATNKGISRSAAIEEAIAGWFASQQSPKSIATTANTTDKSVPQFEYIFATPALGKAIRY